MSQISFIINGEPYNVGGSDVASGTSLNDFLRHHIGYIGTKAMCHEGGCGACVVAATIAHPITKEKKIYAVNSCLVHILSCHQWEITTVEGLGNGSKGYNPIQTRLASFNGTQCGYCTPGWIMNMYSLMESSNGNLSAAGVENSFAGNMCRCTGYRPILDAFKSFAKDADDHLLSKVEDLEDMHQIKCLNSCFKKRCSVDDDDWCIIQTDKKDTMLELSKFNEHNAKWYKAYTIQDIFYVLTREGTDNYKLVAGNTGKGVYPEMNQPRIQIDISSVGALKECLVDLNLVLGAGMTLNEVMEEFSSRSEEEEFSYLKEFRNHLDLVAHVPVRNIGTIGGNLCLKNNHPDFPSDVFLLCTTVDATITTVNSNNERCDNICEKFIETDLNNKLILNVMLPPLSSYNLIKTYKIMPRAQNAHAIVNAGFLFKLDSNKKIIKTIITYGAISPTFIRAKDTEYLIKGRSLFCDGTLQKALDSLKATVTPIKNPPEPSILCRKILVLGLFYKAILSSAPTLNPRYKSGGRLLKRELSKGTQIYDTDKTLWPLNQPVKKLEALTQSSGEVRYACDVSPEPRQLHAAYVLSTVCVAELGNIDASEALKLNGVVSFLSSKDIPGKNSFTPTDVLWLESNEEIFASNRVSYCGQPIGIILAATHKLALKAAALVEVNYKNIVTPVLSIEDVLTLKDKGDRMRQDTTKEASEKGTDIQHVLKGNFSMPEQYHYTMETQSCYAKVIDGVMSLRSATQWSDLVQVAVAQCLCVNENRVFVQVPRVGGGYGGKASRSANVACAASLAAWILRRPVSMVLPITDNMMAVGKRQRCRADYEISIDNNGLIQYLDLTYYLDLGFSYNDASTGEVIGTLTNLYESKRFKIRGFSVLTDKASNTWCRAPATTEGTAIMEHIMERIAYAVKKDAVDIRLLNLPQQSTFSNTIVSFMRNSSYTERKQEIEKFNNENAWKKRSIKLTIMHYPINYTLNYPVTISVYHADGSVAVSHGGIEMGQGINTKIAQVCAYSLKIPLDKILIRETDSFVSANTMVSASSVTSECVAYATVKACEDLLKRLDDVKKDMDDPTWEKVVAAAYLKGINLQVSYMQSPLDNLQKYSIFGACCADIEMDVLTGQHIVRRVDILEDTGVSLSPDIDIGQIEGAFVMGLGLWTCENLVYDQQSGRLLTNRTWNYKPPGIKDIPEDFRITFQRNSYNTAGVLRSKATGEPSLVLAVVVALALHETIHESRKEFGYNDVEWVHVDTPYDIENILKAISAKTKMFKL